MSQRKKVIAIIGSPRKKETFDVLERFEGSLKEKMDVDIENVFLKDLDIKDCLGCFVCLTKGDEFCPFKDDSTILMSKIMKADGVIWATPNYAMNVTTIMKRYLDRTAYTFHRPCFFHKRFTCIVTQGAIGGGDIVRYLRKVALFSGYIYVPGFFVTTVTPRTTEEQGTIDRKVEAAANRYARSFKKSDSPRPSLMMLFVFRLVRSMYRATPNYGLKDVRYFKDNGWFESGYYYPIRLGMIRTIVGALGDALGKRLALKRERELAKSI